MWPPNLPIQHVAGIANLNVEDARSNIRVMDSGLQIDCHIARADGDFLFVTQHGGLKRDMELPVFARWQFTSVMKSTILCIADPTLYLDSAIQVGWYIGSKEADASQATAQIVERVAGQLGYPAEKVVFFSGSGGGFASLRTAAHLDVGRVVAINPQTTARKYGPGAIADVVRTLGYQNLDEAERALPGRLDAIQTVQQAIDQGRDFKAIVCQNIQDEFHLRNHFTPFVEALEGKVAGGVSDNGRLKTILYDSSKGHGPEPLDVTKLLLTEVRDWLAT